MRNKRILTLITLLLFLLLLVGCKAINQVPIITSIPITAVELGETYTYDVNATDPEGDTLTYSLITKPTGMTINSATGLIKWTPKAEGNFAVVVKVSDGVLYIIQSFTIVASKLPDPPAPPPIVNYAPIITSIPGNTAIIGVAYLYDVNATDPEGDVLTYSLTKKPDDMTINSTTGLISWTPASDQIGNNPVIVKVSDGKKATTQSFTITVKAVEPDPEIELTGIVVDPKMMTLFVEEFEDIKSVTATYEIKGLEVPIPLGDCTFLSTDENIAIVGNNGMFTVTAKKVGTANIIVNYGGKADTISVTVVDLVHNINQETYYHTIQDAVNEANPGDTIEVSAGTYEENVTISESVTLRGEDRETTEIEGSGSTTLPILTISADEVTVSGFTIHSGVYLHGIENTIDVKGDSLLLTDLHVIKDKPVGGSAIILRPGVDGFTFTDSTVDSEWNGIYVPRHLETFSSNILIQNVDFNYPGQYAVLLVAMKGATIEENLFNCGVHFGVVTNTCDNIEILNNQFVGSDTANLGIWSQGLAGEVGDFTIQGNDISGFNTGIYMGEELVMSGILKINYNNIFGNTTYGVNYLGSDTVDAEDNWWGIGGTDENAGKPGEDGNNGVSANVDYDPWSTSEF